MLYIAFRNVLDAVIVFSNVLDLSIGGVWALLLTGTNFNISAAVGFISIFGVAIMDGLLLLAYFNQMRLQGLPVEEAIIHGAEKRVRPVMMTALTAIFGLSAGCPLDQDRLANSAAAGDRRGGRHDHDPVPDALFDAGAVQLLRTPRTARLGRAHGALNQRATVQILFALAEHWPGRA